MHRSKWILNNSPDKILKRFNAVGETLLPRVSILKSEFVRSESHPFTTDACHLTPNHLGNFATLQFVLLQPMSHVVNGSAHQMSNEASTPPMNATDVPQSLEAPTAQPLAVGLFVLIEHLPVMRITLGPTSMNGTAMANKVLYFPQQLA